MADQLTPHILLTDQQEGSNANSWGGICDSNFYRLDAVLGDTTEITTTGGQSVLTDGQELVAAIRVDGTLASNAEIVFSGRGGFWVIDNATAGDYTVRAKVSGQTGVEIEQGGSKLIWCDGTDIARGDTPEDVVAEVTIASAATTNILGAASEFVAISGTETITSFGTGASRKRFVRATGAFTITHNATSLICPGGQNIKAAAGDTFLAVSDASSNVRIHHYQRAAAPPQGVPIGAVMDYAGSTAPSFWLLCYGQEVSRTTYAALFAAIGITYGAGDSTTTFNLPDLRGRVVAGKDDMGGTSANRLTNQSGGLNGDVLGATGGAETHDLTEAQLPSHKHAVSLTTSTTGAHRHLLVASVSVSGRPALTSTNQIVETRDSDTSGAYYLCGTSTEATVGRSSETGDHSHTVSGDTANTGAGQAHNNVQPTFILNKIIFAGV